MTVRPLGTVTAKSKVALSSGSSLTGYHVGVPTHSPTTKAPSSVAIQPSMSPFGSTMASGTPA